MKVSLLGCQKPPNTEKSTSKETITEATIFKELTTAADLTTSPKPVYITQTPSALIKG